MHQTLYPWRKSPQHPLDRRLGEPQIQYGCGGRQQKFLPLLGIKPWSSSL